MATYGSFNNYGFFNSVTDSQGYGDRRYTADDLSYFFKGLVNDGIFIGYNNGLAVTPNTTTANTLKVNVSSGRAYFNGRWMEMANEFPLDIAAAVTGMTRIDAVYILVSGAQRTCSVGIQNGNPVVTGAVPPTLTDSSTDFYHVLAYVTVTSGTTSITSDMIEDRRGEPTEYNGNNYAPYAKTALTDVDPDNIVYELKNKLSSELIPSVEEEIIAARAAAGTQGSGYFQPAISRIENASIDVSGWTQTIHSPGGMEYSWMHSISNANVTQDDVATVYFSYNEYKTGNFCPFNQTFAGYINIYAAVKPDSTFTIPLITLTKKVGN